MEQIEEENRPMELTRHQELLSWVAAQAALTRPDNIVWIDGSKAQLDALRSQAVSAGELLELNGDKQPGCWLHRTEVSDVARVEGRTFICCEREEDAGPTNHWMAPDEMRALLRPLYDGCMRGRTMYVIPYSMGVVDSPFARYGVELTDSLYVVLSMAIMTRFGRPVLDALGDTGEYVKCLHAKADIDPDHRYIAHFPQDNTIMSVNSDYGGNALLCKKCFSLRIASVQGRSQGWLAEHMLILGVENPRGEVRYLAAAFPSACGKTDLAMLTPPERYRAQGWKIWCVGDDIAWLRVGPDGRLWAMNPENGYLGVIPGVSPKTGPNILATVSRDTLFTNTAQNLDDDTAWWEGLSDTPPRHALDWKGSPWDGALSAEKGAQANARFCSPITNCPCLSPEYENPAGVPISAIVFGGRRAKVAPLVYQSRDWVHGVFAGSIMASETTAAATGKVGVVRRDPMAMLPFCGYNMADYWRHWLEMGALLGDNAPLVFHVNWFRTDGDGKLLWPGFGENLRVLEWMLRRCGGEAEAVESPVGLLPRTEDIDLEGSGVTRTALENLLSIDKALWRDDVADIRAFYARFGGRLPQELEQALLELEAGLNERPS